MSRYVKILAALMLIAMFALVACDTAEEESQVTQTGYVMGLAIHENPAESSFWGVVETGAKDAAAAVGVELKSRYHHKLWIGENEKGGVSLG